MRGTAVAVAGGILLTFCVGVSAATGGERPHRPGGEGRALLRATVGQPKPSEAILRAGDVVRSLPFGQQRLLIAHAPDGTGRQHTIFAVMSYEPGLAQWYPAGMVDRPSRGAFAWAQMALLDGQQAFAWDALPAGQDVHIDGQALHAQDPAGAIVWNEEVSEVEVR